MPTAGGGLPFVDVDPGPAAGLSLLEGCSLPTTALIGRLTSIDQVLATALRRQERLSSTSLRWSFEPTATAQVRELVDAEARCCSFLELHLDAGTDQTAVEVEVPPTRTTVLDDLVGRGLAALTQNHHPRG